MKLLLFPPAAMLLIFSFTACNNGNTTTEVLDVDTSAIDTATPKVEEGKMVGKSLLVPSKDLFANISISQDHKQFTTTLITSGFDTLLANQGPYTVFAPGDSAFARLPAYTLDNLMRGDKKNELTRLTGYHILPGNHSAASFTDGQKLKTLQGLELSISIAEGQVLINGNKIIIADVNSRNGIIHVIEGVLVPEKPVKK